MNKPKYSEQLILSYARSGYTASDLARVLKISRQRASKLLHKYGVAPRPGPPKLMRPEDGRLYKYKFP